MPYLHNLSPCFPSRTLCLYHFYVYLSVMPEVASPRGPDSDHLEEVLKVRPDERDYVAKWKNQKALIKTVQNILRQIEYYFSNQYLWQHDDLREAIQRGNERCMFTASFAFLFCFAVVVSLYFRSPLGFLVNLFSPLYSRMN